MTDYNIYVDNKHIGMICDVTHIKHVGGNTLNLLRKGIMSDNLIAIIHGTAGKYIKEKNGRIDIL